MGDLGFRKQKGCQGLLDAPQFTPKVGPLGLAVLATAGRRGQERTGVRGWAGQLRPQLSGCGRCWGWGRQQAKDRRQGEVFPC